MSDPVEEEIARALAEWRSGEHAEPWEVEMYEGAATALTPLLNRVRAEAVKEFRINDLRDRAEQADAQWKAWGDVNDAELRDHLRRQADRIEQNSEGNET